MSKISKVLGFCTVTLMSLSLLAEVAPKVESLKSKEHSGLQGQQYYQAVQDMRDSVLEEEDRDQSGEFVEILGGTVSVLEAGQVTIGGALLEDSDQIFSAIDENLQERVKLGEFSELKLRDIDFHKVYKRSSTVSNDRDSITTYDVMGTFGVRYVRSSDYDQEGRLSTAANGTYNINFELTYTLLNGKMPVQVVGDKSIIFSLKKLASEATSPMAERVINAFYDDAYSAAVMESFGMSVLAAILEDNARLGVVSDFVEQEAKEQSVQHEAAERKAIAKRKAQIDMLLGSERRTR